MKKLLHFLFPFAFDIAHLGKYTTLAFVFGTVSVVSGIVLPIFIGIGSWWIVGSVMFGLAILYSVTAFTFCTLSFLELWSLGQHKEDKPMMPVFDDASAPDAAEETPVTSTAEDESATPPTTPDAE